MFIAVLFILTKNWKQPQFLSIGEWKSPIHSRENYWVIKWDRHESKSMHEAQRYSTEWKKKAILKGYSTTWLDYIYITFSKGQKSSDGDQTSEYRAWCGRRVWLHRSYERDCFRVTRMFWIMIVALIAWIYTCVKIPRTVFQEGQFYSI